MFNFSRFALVAALSGAAISATAAQADVIAIQSNNAASTENLGSFTGSLSYTSLGSNSATLVLSITNTTAPSIGGYITAVAILHGDNFAGAAVNLTATSDSDFGNLAAAVSAPPFGSYRGGASTGGGWTGGGTPNVGTGVGQTLVLTFSLSGTGIGLLSASNFVGLHSGHQDMVVRFRGMENGGSDKVPGIVPAPAAASLLGLGGLMASRRRRS